MSTHAPHLAQRLARRRAARTLIEPALKALARLHRGDPWRGAAAGEFPAWNAATAIHTRRTRYAVPRTRPANPVRAARARFHMEHPDALAKPSAELRADRAEALDALADAAESRADAAELPEAFPEVLASGDLWPKIYDEQTAAAEKSLRDIAAELRARVAAFAGHGVTESYRRALDVLALIVHTTAHPFAAMLHAPPQSAPPGAELSTPVFRRRDHLAARPSIIRLTRSLALAPGAPSLAVCV